MGNRRLDSLLTWFPAVTRYLGVAGVVFVTLVWFLANRIEPSLLALFGSMIGVGTGADALRELGQRPKDRG